MSIIYSGNIDQDINNVLTYINAFTDGIGIEKPVVETTLLHRVLVGSYFEFPHDDGLDLASVFKKVANFTAYFVSERPLPNPFPENLIGSDLFKITNHQNAIIAFNCALKSLHEAEISENNGCGTRILTNPIKVSKHSYVDIVEAIATLTPSTGFKILSVFYEQLAYKSNDFAQYELIDII